MISGWKHGHKDKSVEVYHSTLIKGKTSCARIIISKHSHNNWQVLIFSPDKINYTKFFTFPSKTKARKFALNYMSNWSVIYKKRSQ